MDNFVTDPHEFKILIVDDAPTNIDILQKSLDGEGYSISVALDGATALKVAQKLVPDLILLDVMMEGMNGFETCRKLKSDPTTAEASVIFISARGDTRDIVEGFQAGGVDYITKPFNTREVLVRVKNHLFIYNLKQHKEQLIRELEEKNQSLEELHALKNRFLAITAHDIRNPLSSIQSFSELIVRSGEHFSDEEKSKIMELIHKVTRTLGTVWGLPLATAFFGAPAARHVARGQIVGTFGKGTLGTAGMARRDTCRYGTRAGRPGRPGGWARCRSGRFRCVYHGRFRRR